MRKQRILRKRCKQYAKQNLRRAAGCLLCGSCVCLLLYALTWGAAYLTMANPYVVWGGRLFRLSTVLPIFASMLRALYLATNGKTFAASDAFYYLCRPRIYGKTLLVYGVLLFRLALLFWLPLVPLGVGIRLVLERGFIDPQGAGLLLACGIASFLLRILGLNLMLDSFLVPFLYIRNPSSPVRRLFSVSAIGMRGRKRVLVRMAISMLPLIVLSLILPFIFIYIVAVFSVCGKIESERVGRKGDLTDTIVLNSGEIAHWTA